MKKIKLIVKHGKGKYTLVDNENFEYLNQFKWYVNLSGRNKRVFRNKLKKDKNIKTQQIFMHREILNPKNDEMIDHINHNELDNRKENLRVCSNRQNQMNRRSRKNSTSKYKGVHWYKTYKKWQAQIKAGAKRISIGYFNDEIEAAKAYDKKAMELHGDYANLNFNY